MVFLLRRAVMAVLASTLYSYLALATSESSAPTEALHTRHYFYVGGEYVNIPGGHAFQNQMYVEKLTPQHGSSKPYPIVFVHGGDQTGTNFLNKPDGGRGWASWFLDRGYEVYIVDRTLTARSAYQPSSNLSLGIFSVEFISQRFTAVQNYPLWPQAKLHTQWPGTGEMGDPIFDNYYASNVQAVSDTIAQETTMKAAGEALLDKIGPAVVITHSQGGLYGWQWADNRPELVKALIQIEPKGPPFQEVIFSSAFDRPYGLTSIPLQYDPMPTNTSVPFETVVVPAPVNDSSLYPCLIQKEPASKLPNLAKVPILIETGEASYHATYDYCVIEFLKQAGVNAQHLELGKVGIHGNAHLQFMEKNSDDIAAVLHNWIVKTVK